MVLILRIMVLANFYKAGEKNLLISEEIIDDKRIVKYQMPDGRVTVMEHALSDPPIDDESETVKIPKKPTLEEIQTQTLLNTEYLVIMSELNSL